MRAVGYEGKVHALALDRLDAEWANINNSLIGRVVNFVAPNGSSSQLEFIAPTKRASVAMVKVKWGAHLFEMRITTPALVPALEIAVRPDLPLPIWRLAVEEALSDWIALLSEASGTPAVLVELVRDAGAAPLNLSMGLRLYQAQRLVHGTVTITASDVAGWQWVSNRMGPAPTAPVVIDPLMTLSFRLQPICVPIHELRMLQVGDVVLLDEHGASTAGLPLTCVIGERIVRGIHAISNGVAIQLSNQPVKELTVALEPNVNPRPSKTSPKAGDVVTPDIPQGPDSLDALEMWLQFEVGHTKMTLGQVRALKPGQVLVDMGDDSTHEVRVLCNGRWIATGRLVSIGQRLGVQVTNLGGVDQALGESTTDEQAPGAPSTEMPKPSLGVTRHKAASAETGASAEERTQAAAGQQSPDSSTN